MNNYIFITMTIAGIGGAEQYIYNKATYLEKIGYRVIVFSSIDRPIMIDGLNKYKEYITPALMYSPSLFSDKEVNKTCSFVKDKYEKYDNNDLCIIESNSIAAAKWGELIAKQLKAIHIVFNLQEIHNYSESELSFLKFKNNRNELAGITDASFPLMLGENEALYNRKMVFNAICSNVVQDCEISKNQIFPSADLTIGSIGRLDKAYVKNIAYELRAYFMTHSSSKFNMIFIGGAEKKKVINEIYEIFDKLNNVKLIITGNIYPIPRKLLKQIEVFVSTSGSANVTFYEGLPTIKVHPVTGQPVGIMGYSFDVDNSSMYEPLTGATLNNQLELIIEKKINIKYDLKYNSKINKKIDDEFGRQLSIAIEHRNEEYFDTREIPSNYSRNKSMLYSILGRLFGGEKMQKILEIFRKAIR